MPPLFNTPFGLKIDVRSLVGELIRFIRERPGSFYKIIIGTDSEQFLDKSADFVTAVVIHRVGNGGRYFWRRAGPAVAGGKFHTLRDRIIKEVLLSLEVAKEVLVELRKETEFTNWDFEIHADIG